MNLGGEDVVGADSATDHHSLTANATAASSAVEAARRMDACYRRRDWKRLRSCYHDDARLITAASEGATLGPDEMIAVLQQMDETVWSVSAEVVYLPVDEVACVLQARVRYPQHPSGFADSAFYWLCTFEDGLLYRSRVFRSRVEAVACYASHGASLGIK